MAEWYFILRHNQQFFDRIIISIFAVPTLAFLDQPQSHDVLQQTVVAARVAAFIGKVMRKSEIVDDRRGSFHTHQRPGAAADNDRVFA
jgi:hypothetical protein